MSRYKPHKIIIEFEDGSKVENSFSALPVPIQVEILRQPFAAQSSLEPEKEKFLLLEWEDGWKEVVGVDSACSEINRYYVISRTEEVGRLSLHRDGGYPELVEIIRNPLKLNRIHFQDTFQLVAGRSDREGGKTDTFFNMTKEKNVLSEYMAVFKKAIAEEGIDVSALQSQSPELTRELYEKIRRRMRIKAGHRQQDVYDFIASLIIKLTT